MAWGNLGTQFCLELAFGVLMGLCLIPRAPMGLFFYRMIGTTAVLPLVVAAVAPPLFAGADWTAPATVCAGVGALSFPVFSGPVSGSRRLFALCWATAWTGFALAFTVQEAAAVEGAGSLVLGTLSAMATGVVAGGVGLAMVVGHWYLTVPQLPIFWLRKLNRFTAIAMTVSAALLILTCFVHTDHMTGSQAPLLSAFGLLFLTARIAVGLALPLLFAWMTAGSLAYSNTRSATGILYASTVLVLIGTAVSLSLQDRYGFPL
jgi:hypothetical protein